MSLLHFHNITKEYGNRNVLDGIDLSIEKRERVALIGDNGSGKSTLIRIAMHKETADTGRVILAKGIKVGYLSQNSDELMGGQQNALHIDEHQQLEMHLRQLEGELAHPDTLASQDLYDKVIKLYDKTLHAYEAMDGYTLESTIRKTLLGLGLKKDALTRPLESLSGGERMRVAMARILIESPDLLILDEPTNHLDLPGIEWLEDYLLRFQGGVLLVSHDRYFLDRVTSRTAELSHGKLLIKSCNYSSFMQQKEHIKAFYLKEGKNMRIRLRDKKAQVEKLLSNNKIKQAKSRLHDIEKMERELKIHHNEFKETEHLGHKSGPHLKFQAHGHVSKEIAWGSHVTKSFGPEPLFSDINFHIAGGERVAIIGPNGCGKSTLLKMLMGQDHNYSGALKLGEWVNFSYLGQSVEFEEENRTILEEIMIPFGLEEPDARNHLAKFQFYGDVVDTKLAKLSGGERVRVYLSEIMLKSPHCLILDEPTNHLDLASRESIEHAVNAFNGSVIAVSHDRYYLNHCVDKILAFTDDGFRTFEGNYDAYKDQHRAEILTEETRLNQQDPIKNRKKSKGNSKGNSKTKIELQQKKNTNHINGSTITDVENQIMTLESEIHYLTQRLTESYSTGKAFDISSKDYITLTHMQKELEELYIQYESYV